MATMNISLPDALKQFIDEQVANGGYGTSSEYVRELVRRDQDRLRVRELVLEGPASPAGPKADARYFEALRTKARAKARATPAKPRRR